MDDINALIRSAYHYIRRLAEPVPQSAPADLPGEAPALNPQVAGEDYGALVERAR